MQSTGSKKKNDVPLMAFAFSLFIIVVVVVGQSWWSSREDQTLTLADAQQHSYFTVRILEEHASRVLNDAVRIIDLVSDDIGRQADRPNSAPQDLINHVFERRRQDNQFLLALSLYDLDGQLLGSSRLPVHRGVELAPKLLQQLSAADDKQVVIGALEHLTASDQWIIPVARRLRNADGMVFGVLVADVRLNYLQDFYEVIAHGSSAEVALSDLHGQLLIHAPYRPELVNQPISQQPVLEAISSNNKEGVLHSGPLLGGRGGFLYTYRKIAHFPLVLVYGRSLDVVLSDWQDRTRQRMIFTAMTVMIMLILAAGLFWQLKRLKQSNARIDASESRYRLLFSAAQDAILLINRNYIYVDCNAAAVKIMEVDSESDLIGHPVGQHSAQIQNVPGIRETDRQLAARALVDKAFEGETQTFEWVIMKRGKPHYFEITLSPVELDGETLLFCVERDIHARKYTELLLEGQNHLLQMIGGNEDPVFVLNSVCDFVTSMRPEWSVGIQLLADDLRTFSQVTGMHFPAPLRAQIAGLPVSHGNGIWSEAVLVACPITETDLLHADSMKFVNDLESLNAFQAGFSWPLMDKHGQVLGAFTLLVRENHSLNEEDMSLIGIMIEIAGIAIEGRRSEKKILQLAHYDELTGLPNRFLYNQHLSKALALAERNRGRLAVLFLDLDRFKNINDTFGHEEGDKVLRSVAQRFRQTLRESDIVARIGGDEFILLIEHFNEPKDLGDIADKLLFEACQPFEIFGQECQLSASIGIATFPADGRDAQTLLKNADIAMYRAKNRGKDNYQFYASEMNTHTIERLAFEARLRKALERREFVVYYQPKIRIDTGRIVGAEALVRWNHPERGILFPGDFIGLAEEAGLIGRLGMLVLDIACRDVLSFRQIDYQFGRVAINLSGSQFNDPQLLEEIRSITSFWRTPSSAIEFEITESMVMHNQEQAIHMMDGFREAGFALSIDDFGTGYSSLAYLKRFPVDSVKVDRSFIKDIPEDPNDTAIVQAIVAMAHTLGLKVIAEGVDAETQLQTLKEFRCDEYQGYFFSKAIPLKEFQQLLQAQEPGATH